MCAPKAPKTPEAPAPLAAAPTLPGQVSRGTNTKKKANPNSYTSPRGIYQNTGGKDFLGQ